MKKTRGMAKEISGMNLKIPSTVILQIKSEMKNSRGNRSPISSAEIWRNGGHN